MAFTKDSILAEIAKQDSKESGSEQQNNFLESITVDKPVDILTYIEAEWGLAEKPYPIQCFILKLIYGLPLDGVNKNIILWDQFQENIEHVFNEVEFISYLYNEKRCNISLENHNRNLGRVRNNVNLRLGRRGGKTSMSQWIAAYTMYKLLKHKSPQEYYHIRKDQPISITLISTSEDHAEALLSPARSLAKRSPYLKQFIRGDSSRRISFTTTRNKELGLDEGLLVTAAPCSARSVRGPANIAVLLEEYGWFYWELKGSNKSDKEIYRAVSPSTADFKNPVSGLSDGQIFVVSTPKSRESYMFTLETAIWNGSLDGLIIHLPSWWANPRITTEKLKEVYITDPIGFDQEYGANYSDQSQAAFTRAMVDSCRKDPMPTMLELQRDEICFMGFDLGLVKDGTTISIVACNQTGECRLVHHEQIRVKLDNWEEYALSDNEGNILDELDIIKLAKRVDYLWEYYGCKGGIGDQYESSGVKSHLLSGARNYLEFVDMTQSLNDKIAKHIIATISQKRVIFYYKSEEWENVDSLIRELTRLQRTDTSGNPPKTKLHAPNVVGFHDDQYSSLSRALWAAKLVTEEMVFGVSSVNSEISRMSRAVRERAEVLKRQNSTGRYNPNKNFMRRIGR